MVVASPECETVAIAGLGTVGRVVAEHLTQMAPYELTAVSARDGGRAKAFLSELAPGAAIVPFEQLVEHATTVVECAPAEHFRSIAEPVIASGGTLIPLSVGALLDNWSLVDDCARTGARILVPTGALVGLDAVQAAALGTIHSVRMITRKPVAGLEKSVFVTDNAIDLSSLEGPRLLFSGTAREAIAAFPANLNVLVALSLAGIGPDRTMTDVWVDPSLTRNTHRIAMVSDSVTLDLGIQNIPTDDNPATGRLTALSVVALLRKLTTNLRIGT